MHNLVIVARDSASRAGITGRGGYGLRELPAARSRASPAPEMPTASTCAAVAAESAAAGAEVRAGTDPHRRNGLRPILRAAAPVDGFWFLRPF